MRNLFQKLLFAAALATLLVGAGLISGSAPPVVAAADSEDIRSLLFPPLPAFSDAWFTGTWCYINCSDGTFSTVRTFSTSQCCNECADFCGSGCVANGGGPSVLCGAE